VIVFAARELKLDLEQRPRGTCLMRPSDTQGILDCLAQIKSLDRGILVLDFAQTHGIDPRFKKDARVVVAHDGKVDVERVQQALSRGSRSLGAKIGYVFKVADGYEEEAYKISLAGETDMRLQNSSRILQILQTLQGAEHKMKDKQASLNNVLKKFGLRQQWDEFYQRCSQKVQKVLDKASSQVNT
jgi:hypothetical protein